MPDLEIERDDRFIAAERTVHHVAVGVMAVVVLAGALGVFGFGPLSSVTSTGDGFEVTYDRFARNGAPFALLITTTATEMWIDDTLLEATQLERIVPAPAEEIRAEDGTTFVFDRSTGARTRATFHMTGDAVGIVRGRTGVSPGDTAAVSVLFYP